ncbi:MAG: DUF945 family protein [Pseudomonadota bacterium]
MKLNKWMIAGAAVIIGAGAAPWGVGYVTEQQWLQATQEVNRAQPFVRLNTDSYDRGVLGAETSGTFTITDPATGESRQVEFLATITHGITGSLMEFRPRQGWQPEGADWFPEDSPRLTLESRVWGSATLELDAPVMEISHPDSGEMFRSSGGLARIDVGSMGEQADLLMVWPEMALTGPDADVIVRGIELEQEMAWLSGDVWTGSGTMTLDNLSVQSPQTPPVVFDGITLTSSSEAGNEGRDLDSDVALDLESVTVEGTSYGPHRLSMFLDDLDVASWNDFSSVMTEMQALAMQDELDSRAAFEQQMQLMQRVTDSAQNLVAAGFSAGIRELSLSTPEGEIKGDLELSHPRLSDSERSEMLMIMQRLTGSLNFSLPVALAENYPELRMQVAPLIKEGLLVQDGDRLVMRGQMQEMVLDINGVALPLPPLL